MSWKQELLDREESAWRALCSRFEAVAEDAWTKPGASGDWSVRDVMAHVASWHAEVALLLERRRSGDATPVKIDVERMNEEFHERCKDMSVHDVRAMSGAAWHRMREEIARMPDEASERLRAFVGGCSHEHYAEHVPDLDRFLGRA